jgi:hypothetical protein
MPLRSGASAWACDESLVPAGIEVHVRVDLQIPILAAVEAHRDRACPARAARVARVDAHVAHARRRRQRHRVLVDHAEMDVVGAPRVVERAREGEAEDRVAVRCDTHEDRHGATLPRRAGCRYAALLVPLASERRACIDFPSAARSRSSIQRSKSSCSALSSAAMWRLHASTNARTSSPRQGPTGSAGRPVASGSLCGYREVPNPLTPAISRVSDD